DDIRLCAVQKAEGHARIRGMKHRTLPFDHVPVIRRSIGSEHFGGACNEVRYYRIDRNPGAGDENASLTRGSELRMPAGLVERARQRKCRVLFPERAIGPYRQQALARALAAGGDRNIARRHSYIDQLAAELSGGGGQCGILFEPTVHAADDMEASLQCTAQG